jgi:hypothetical protein
MAQNGTIFRWNRKAVFLQRNFLQRVQTKTVTSEGIKSKTLNVRIITANSI